VLFSFSLVPSSVQRHSVFAVKNRVFPCSAPELAFSLTRSLLFSQIFTRAFCFSPELPHRPAWCFPALLAIFLAPVVISAQGAPVILFSAAQCFGRSALLVRRRVLQFSLRSFGFRSSRVSFCSVAAGDSWPPGRLHVPHSVFGSCFRFLDGTCSQRRCLPPRVLSDFLYASSTASFQCVNKL
jgi:hypothetical protein